MSEQHEQTQTRPSPVPAAVSLEDFIEAVTRGVTRAIESQDDVGGYVMRQAGERSQGGTFELPGGIRPITILAGIFAPGSIPGGGNWGGESAANGGRQ